jgi:hypothetical protein
MYICDTYNTVLHTTMTCCLYYQPSSTGVRGVQIACICYLELIPPFWSNLSLPSVHKHPHARTSTRGNALARTHTLACTPNTRRSSRRLRTWETRKTSNTPHGLRVPGRSVWVWLQRACLFVCGCLERLHTCPPCLLPTYVCVCVCVFVCLCVCDILPYPLRPAPGDVVLGRIQSASGQPVFGGLQPRNQCAVCCRSCCPNWCPSLEREGDL